MSQMLSRLKQLWQWWHRSMTRLTTRVALTLVYVFGIGGTSIAARLFGKKFLQSRFVTSSWQSVSGSTKLEKMF